LDILTPKEMEVLKLISKGYSNSKISKELNIAEITVKKHIGSMFQKLDVKDRLSLALILK
jgi:DNA-binding NarL/FixJ family response regulator